MGFDLSVLLVFLATVIAIMVLPYDKSLIALFGAIAMVLISKQYSFEDAFNAIEWDVIFVLIGTWIITGYMSKSGLPNHIVAYLSKRFRYPAVLMLLIVLLSGFLSMFLTNVLIVLLFGELAISIALMYRLDPLVAAMAVGLAANYMGTALMVGDFPPLLLHEVAGAEFADFIVFKGVPSSMPLLTASFLATVSVFYFWWFRGLRGEALRLDESRFNQVRLDKVTAIISVLGLTMFIVLATLRPILGVSLGALAISSAVFTALVLEVLRHKLRKDDDIPPFEAVVKDLDWSVVLFYAALFVLVGGLEAGGVLRSFAEAVTSFIGEDIISSYTAIFWLTALLSAVVEHDALVLFLFLLIKEVGTVSGVNVWPFYWAVAWAGTLGSNATIVAAPTLYVALTMAEKARGRKASLSEWLKLTLAFTAASLVVHYLISIPFAEAIYSR